MKKFSLEWMISNTDKLIGAIKKVDRMTAWTKDFYNACKWAPQGYDDVKSRDVLNTPEWFWILKHDGIVKREKSGKYVWLSDISLIRPIHRYIRKKNKCTIKDFCALFEDINGKAISYNSVRNNPETIIPPAVEKKLSEYQKS